MDWRGAGGVLFLKRDLKAVLENRKGVEKEPLKMVEGDDSWSRS